MRRAEARAGKPAPLIITNPPNAVKEVTMKEFLTALGYLLIAFGLVKLVLALVQRQRSK